MQYYIPGFAIGLTERRRTPEVRFGDDACLSYAASTHRATELGGGLKLSDHGRLRLAASHTFLSGLPLLLSSMSLELLDGVWSGV